MGADDTATYRPALRLPPLVNVACSKTIGGRSRFVAVSWRNGRDDAAMAHSVSGLVYGARSWRHARTIFLGLIQADERDVAREIAARRGIARALASLGTIVRPGAMTSHDRMAVEEAYRDAIEATAPLAAPEPARRLDFDLFLAAAVSERRSGLFDCELRGQIGTEVVERKLVLRSSEARLARLSALALATAPVIDLAATLHTRHLALLRGLLPYIAGMPSRTQDGAVRRLCALGPEPLRDWRAGPHAA